MRRRTLAPFAPIVGLMLLVAGCAADASPDADSDGAATPGANDGGTASEAPVDPTDTTETLGTVVVDGVEYDITEVRNCEPLSDGTVERELELQGFGTHDDGERVQIDVYIQTLAGVPYDDVSWNGPEGVFGGPDDADIALINDGAIVTGSATLVDAMNQTETIGIGFTLEVTVACR